MDITTLKRERELLESIINAIPVMINIYDPMLKSFRFNQEIKKIFGYSEEDAANGSFMQQAYPDPDYRDEVMAFMQAFEPGWKEFTALAKDGKQIEGTWTNVSLKDGTKIGIGINLQDVKQAERKLRESEARLLEAQRLAHVGSFIYDAATDMLDWTEEVFRIFDRDQKKGNPTFADVLSYVHPDDREHVLSCLKKAEENKEHIEMEYKIISDDGRIKYYYAWALLKSGDYKQAEDILNENGALVIEDMREGTNPLSDLWLGIEAAKAAAQDRTFNPDTAKIPDRFDYRMV
jgi:PAS domain S-box-containing protein